MMRQIAAALGLVVYLGAYWAGVVFLVVRFA